MQQITRMEIGLAFAIVLLSAAMLSFVYMINGPSWDLIVHYFNGRSMLLAMQGVFENRVAIIAHITAQTDTTYYENFRAPLSGAIIMAMLLFLGKPITAYLALLFAMLLAAAVYAARSLKADSLLLVALVFNPYTVYYMFIFNSTEALSSALLLVGIGLIARKSPYAGAVLGIAALAKYPAGIFLPLLLLLRTPKKIAIAVLLAALVTAPWLAFEYALTGNPLMSYLQSFGTAIGGSIAHTGFKPMALVNVAAYPIAMLLLALALFVAAARKKLGSAFPRLRLGYNGAVLASVLALAAAEFVFTGGRYGVFVQSRFGYILALALEVSVAYAIGIFQERLQMIRMLKPRRMLSIVVGLATIIVMLYMVWYYYNASQYGSAYYYNPDLNSSVYASAKSELSALGYGNCRIVSNAWPYMRYLGVYAYMPFYENATELRYPILAFSSMGPQGIIENINSSVAVYSSANFSVYAPSNAICMH